MPVKEGLYTIGFHQTLDEGLVVLEGSPGVAPNRAYLMRFYDIADEAGKRLRV